MPASARVRAIGSQVALNAARVGVIAVQGDAWLDRAALNGVRAGRMGAPPLSRLGPRVTEVPEDMRHDGIR